MKFSASISAIVAACALASSTVAAGGAVGAAWGYKYNDSALASPTEWGDHYPHCNGISQSPIDIVSSESKIRSKVTPFQRKLCLLQPDADYRGLQGERCRWYVEFLQSIVCYTTILNCESCSGSCQVKANNARYDLAQFHVHAPSEHTINGDPLDGEVHFVHSNADGSALLVVGVFMEIDPSGDTDPWLESVIDGIDDVTPTAPTMMEL
ncbi:unnamed protein product [Phytophthora lilii]|uniref:carbonic anhydrase n=1 Tax=Phytophthora lilii TaxID=2077276 RepID=A0A9W6X074_9STRA|nr:unnamed protein product [Phytophthora lilii]